MRAHVCMYAVATCVGPRARKVERLSASSATAGPVASDTNAATHANAHRVLSTAEPVDAPRTTTYRV